MKTVVITPSTSGLPPDWSIDRFREALQRAADSWSFPSVRCGVKLVVGQPQAEWRAVRDGTNLVAFRSKDWCHNERCGPTSTFPLRAMGMTTPYPGGAGLPEEADVELNAVTFRLAGNGDVGKQLHAQWSTPIEPVLVHELGHVLGLPDVCGGERRASGRAVTSACSAQDRQRVMFAANLNAHPAHADVAELCRLYPADGSGAIEVAEATPASGHGVPSGFYAAGSAHALIPLAIVALAIVVARRMRRVVRFFRRPSS
jgi:hypothetical protein